MIGKVLNIIKDLEKEGMAMGAVTQEMGFAREVGDRVLFMDGCIVVENDTSLEIFFNVWNERIVSSFSKVCDAVFNLIFLFL